MSEHADSGTAARMHTRTSEFLTQMVLAIAPRIRNICTKARNEEKRSYNQRVQEVERDVFTPLVFSTSGGMGRECTVFYRRMADLLSRKRDKPYSVKMGWLRCCLNFALLRSAILCIRGSRSSQHHPFQESNITLATVEGRVAPDSD